jgi:hypothetical protein
MMKPQRPTGVTVLAICYLLFGIVALLLGALLAAAGGSGILNSVGYGALSGLVSIVGGVLAVVGILGILVGWGMWSGKGWAWIVALVLSALGIIGGLGSLVTGSFSGIVSLAIDVLILWYLFRPHVKAYFGRGAPTVSPMSPPPSAPTT